MKITPEKLIKLMFRKPEDFLKIFTATLKKNIYTWNYFVDWEKVNRQIEELEKELNLLNFLIGKSDFEKSLEELITSYPSVIKTFPLLLAIRSCEEIEVLTSIEKFNYLKISFSTKNTSPGAIRSYIDFFNKTGLKSLFQKRIKNVVDYVTGIKVGMDTNARKNRTGKLMETLIETYLKTLQKIIDIDFISQATKSKIKERWDKEIDFDKIDRKIDFAVKTSNKIHFIEVNFYATSGSKLKATAGEYKSISEFWKKQNINFIWITDGQGWLSTEKALMEYLENKNILLNLHMTFNGLLKYILEK
ncbi:type II restriction endonuclease [Desulfurobacterium sp.]